VSPQDLGAKVLYSLNILKVPDAQDRFGRRRQDLAMIKVT
jgi:hypothetical protein